MLIRGVNFGPVWAASGVQGFYGDVDKGYKAKSVPLAPTLAGLTHVTKTATLYERAFPRKIVSGVRGWWGGFCLNSVRLSNPGIQVILGGGRLQKRPDPLWISLALVEDVPERRLQEAEQLAGILRNELPGFRAAVGIQLNPFCPSLCSGAHTDEILAHLDIFAALGVPLAVKFSLASELDGVRRVAAHPACDALVIANALTWGSMPEAIHWHKIFGTRTSPLADYGGGGLSGAPLYPLVLQMVADLRRLGVTKHINAGSAQSIIDAWRLLWSGADSIAIGTVARLRWWRADHMIRYLRTHDLPDWHGTEGRPALR